MHTYCYHTHISKIYKHGQSSLDGLFNLSMSGLEVCAWLTAGMFEF